MNVSGRAPAGLHVAMLLLPSVGRYMVRTYHSVSGIIESARSQLRETTGEPSVV